VFRPDSGILVAKMIKKLFPKPGNFPPKIGINGNGHCRGLRVTYPVRSCRIVAITRISLRN